MTTISEQVTDIQNQIILSKLAESIVPAEFNGEKIVILHGLPIPFNTFNLYLLGLLRCESRLTYDGTIKILRQFWTDIDYNFQPIEKKKNTKLGFSTNWQPSPEYLEKLPDARLVDTVLETITNVARTMGEVDATSTFINTSLDFKPFAEHIYELMY